MHAFHNALAEVKAKHCSANSDWPYKELSRLATQPPARIYGDNSRMDNRREVQGAEATDLFILNLSEAYTDAWISNDYYKRQAILNALFAWAKADALTETKPCA